MSEGTFLTADEVAELSGIRTGRNVHGKTVRREQLQAEWLRQAGIPFFLNARGRPIIVRSNLTSQRAPVGEPKPAWQPRVVRPA